MKMPLLLPQERSGSRSAELTVQGLSSCNLQDEVSAFEARSTPAEEGRHPDVHNTQKYLCYFLHRFLSFRHAEISALASALGVHDVRWKPPAGGNNFSPFWYLQLPSDEVANQIASRSILLKGFYELWGEGETFEELESQLKCSLDAKKKLYGGADISWKIIVDSWGQTIKLADQIKLINKLAFLDFKGPIRLKDADVVFRLIITNDKVANGLPQQATPVRWYFGREVAVSNRKVISQYALPDRLYIGPTSMDTEMAFVMCNMAQVGKGDLIYDPFVGTGSILVAASHLGARTMGADIDIRVVRDGKVARDGQVLDVWGNFRQYKLEAPAGLLRMDAHVAAFRICPHGFLDAVLCDPPYGVRAGGRRSLCFSETGVLSKISQRRALVYFGMAQVEKAEDWFPPTQGYTLTECLTDVLAFSAQHLCLGGRLVYFLPAAPQSCQGADVPKHPALKLISNCEQVLTRRYSRRLVTMEKVKHYDATEAVEPIDPQIEANLSKLHDVVYDNSPASLQKPKYRGKVC